MQETHIFNKNLKRLEPIDSKCMFCDVRYSQNMNDNCFIPLFKENDRTNIIVYKSVQYSKIHIGVSRCPHCLTIYKSARLKAKLWGNGIAICIGSGAICWISLGFPDNLFLRVFGIPLILLSMLIGYAIYLVLRKIFVKRKGMLNERDAANKYKIVQDLIRDGWTFNQPTA
jgi:hypothetical protein